ncbi:MAG: hypothetical protein PVG13_09740 [Thiohalophilus sp.]|jgi:hypothetical protein
MPPREEQELKEIQRRIVVTQVLGAPGAVLLGLGLYGKFGAKGDAFISILNEPEAVSSAILAGAIVMAWEAITVIRLLRRKAELLKK